MPTGRGAAKKSRGPAVVFRPRASNAALQPWVHSRPPNPLLQALSSGQTRSRRSMDIMDDVAGEGARSCEAHTCRLAMIVDVSMTSTRGTAMRCRRTWCKPKLQYLTVDKSRPSDASRRAWSKSRSQHCSQLRTTQPPRTQCRSSRCLSTNRRRKQPAMLGYHLLPRRHAVDAVTRTLVVFRVVLIARLPHVRT